MKTITNPSAATASVDFSVAKSVTKTSSYSHTVGVSVTTGTEFAVGIPLLAEGKVSLEISASYEHTWGKETSLQKL